MQNKKSIINLIKNLIFKTADSKLGQIIEKVITKAASVTKVLDYLGGALDIVETVHSIKEDIDTLRTLDSMGKKAIAVLDIADNTLILILIPQTKVIRIGITIDITIGKMLYSFFKASNPPLKPNTPPIEVFTSLPPDAFCNS